MRVLRDAGFPDDVIRQLSVGDALEIAKELTTLVKRSAPSSTSVPKKQVTTNQPESGRKTQVAARRKSKM